MIKIINFKKFIKESLGKNKYVNNFDFILGKTYEYEELPKKVKDDIDIQFEENYEETPHDYKWKFTLLNPDETEEYLTSAFGQYLDEPLEHEYMQKLIKNIKRRGLDWPAVGTEGHHRALACWYLKMPLPYLKPIYKY